MLPPAPPPSDPTVKILHAAYVSKRAHSNMRWKSRYVVLTGTHLHWFKKQQGDSLFGYELGCVEIRSISRITKTSPSTDGWSYFEVEAIEEDGWVTSEPFIRNFRVETRKERDVWVRILNAAVKGEDVPGVKEVPYFLVPGIVTALVLWHLTAPTQTFTCTMLSLKISPTSTSLSEDSEEEEEENIPPVPTRFIEGLKDQGGLPEATRRWRATAEWRKRFNIDTLLTKPLPEFTAIKESYPLYYHGLTKPVFPDGKGGFYSHLVYIERPGKCDMEKLSAIGMPSLQQFMRFITEWVYTYLAVEEESKIFNIVDVEDFKLTELKGDRLEFFKFITGLSQDHYPERASVIAVVNAPSWFTMLFRLIKPMINENTQKKIRVLSRGDTYNGLNSGKPLPRPPHWNREDVLQPQKDLALNDAIWEGDSHDPFYVSDIHLPLSSQKSKFALTAQGVLGPDGKPIFSIDNPEPTDSNTPTNLNKGRSNSPSPSRSDKSKFVPIGTRPHSASMNSSERSDNDDTPEPERSSSARLPRSDSTLDFRGEENHNDNADHYGDSDSGSDSEDDRPRRQSHTLRTVSAASASDGGSWFTQNLPQPTKVLHEGWIYKKATGEGFFGRRNWAPRWAKLVEAVLPSPEGGFAPSETPRSEEPVPCLMMYWYESSLTPSSFIVLDDCVTVPVDRSAEEWNSHCFDLVHLPAKRQTRSFSALNAAQRDEWVSKVNKILSARES
ncbi:hypothetical protein TL16_g08310 [Triparma laevis f. inornata]|uniref:Uncharacterized protein n=1 Tax=Triparma laevis f. inornata TaxID=1714386 RepID=A0A9W7EK43_9STRA|nr:hypothetical protein TL16_g08310 [Triparma laevis f. inornata]